MLTVTSNNTMTVTTPEVEVDPRYAPTTPAIKKRLSDAIRKGLEFYPDVHHEMGEYVTFTVTGKPTTACALGYGILGEFGDVVNEDNLDRYIYRFEKEVLEGDEGIICAVLDWNDTKELKIVEILEKIAQ